MGGTEYTLKGLKDEEAPKFNNQLELAGWASKETSCMGRPRRPTLSLLENRDIVECHEEPKRSMFRPWDDGDPTLEPKPPGDPTLGVQGEGGCTFHLGG